MIAHVHCPQCHKRLDALHLGTAATFVSKRTCPKCRTLWQVITKPIRHTDGAWYHSVDWVSLGRAPDR